MANKPAPIIFSQTGAASEAGATYTVSADKYAIVNASLFSVSTGSTGTLVINGKTAFKVVGTSTAGYAATSANGIVCTAGTTIQVTGATNGGGIASGFLYDA